MLLRTEDHQCSHCWLLIDETNECRFWTDEDFEKGVDDKPCPDTGIRSDCPLPVGVEKGKDCDCIEAHEPYCDYG